MSNPAIGDTVANPGLRGHVAVLVTDSELVFTLGMEHGVEINMIFDVLDHLTENVRDPRSGQTLGSIDRVKTQVRVVKVEEKIALARILKARPSSISTVAEVFAGTTTSGNRPLRVDAWPEGVVVSDPVRFTGRFWDPSTKKPL